MQKDVFIFLRLTNEKNFGSFKLLTFFGKDKEDSIVKVHQVETTELKKAINLHQNEETKQIFRIPISKSYVVKGR